MVNLISEQQRELLRDQLKKRLTVGVLMLAGLVCVMIVLILAPILYSFTTKTQSYTKERDRITAALERIRVSPEDSEVREYVYLLEQSEDTLTARAYSVALEEVIRARPDGVKVYSVALGPGEGISVQGEVNTRASLVEFASALRREKSIAHVDVPIANFVEGTNAPFSISLTLHGTR